MHEPTNLPWENDGRSRPINWQRIKPVRIKPMRIKPVRIKPVNAVKRGGMSVACCRVSWPSRSVRRGAWHGTEKDQEVPLMSHLYWRSLLPRRLIHLPSSTVQQSPSPRRSIQGSNSKTKCCVRNQSCRPCDSACAWLSTHLIVLSAHILDLSSDLRITRYLLG